MKQEYSIKHPKQDQHKIPQVYLKQFGYVDQNNQWKVSVRNAGESFTRQKSIKSFTAITNIFDINSYDPIIQRIFEDQLNCRLEDGYLDIINDLESFEQLSEKSQAYILQLVANLMARSDYWRKIISALCDSPNKPRFLKFLTGHHCRNEQEYKNIHEQPFYKMLMQDASDKAVNRVLLFFMDHLMLRLWNYEIVIVQSQEDKPWFTSTNPVVVNHQVRHFELFPSSSEFYLPLSPKYLAYLHYPGSDDKANPLRALPANCIHVASDDQNWDIQQLIMRNQAEYVIIAGELTYRVDK
ncbi:hypothetical protein FAES_pFAES01137 (plasmid) [Fibrella aestuarina BUZ 2]|uniref:DUF4238 domain-containing protein n=1 Tax=Fibrella aestuarina BUZ 2 TaxID=1166018 RepID=I0KHM4_9BACT|nr:DUF4238 domain-containing protein [Fibrella aestuarina]CCH03627.1 hypothetical protein FAES_pFAES01137 [Fibrella aestuarina BUZ 2]